MKSSRWIVVLAVVVATSRLLAVRTADEPETVMITLQAKPGSEDALARVIARHWDTARQLNLVRADTPHVTLRGTDGDNTYFVDIFTWRDASVPDAAPAPILAIWQELNGLVEKRHGRPGLDIVQMALIAH